MPQLLQPCHSREGGYPDGSHSSHMHTEFLLVKNNGKWLIWTLRTWQNDIKMDLMETECEVRWTQLVLDHVQWSFKISGVEPLGSAGTITGIIIISSSTESSSKVWSDKLFYQHISLFTDVPLVTSCWEMWKTYFNFHHYGKYSLSPSICRFQGSGKAITIACNQCVFKKYLLQQNTFQTLI